MTYAETPNSLNERYANVENASSQELELGGKKLQPGEVIQMKISSEGEKKVIAKVGGVQLTETTYHLEPVKSSR